MDADEDIPEAVPLSAKELAEAQGAPHLCGWLLCLPYQMFECNGLCK